MTIEEAITRIDALKPNTYTQEEKIEWLSVVDGIVKRLVIDTHEGAEDVVFEGYTPDTPLDTELIVGHPYDEMYIDWLEARIDYYNAEYIRYNNSITKYNDMYQAFANDYNRTHMPNGHKIKFF